MNTLAFLGLPPLQITRASLRIERSPTLPSIAPHNPHGTSSPKRAWKLQAEAKGFGRAAVRVSEEKKRSQDDNVSNNGNDNDNDDKIPQVIWERMIVRILFYVGIPMATGVALLYIFSALKDQHVWDVPLWLPFLSTLLAFGTSALGIAYGTLSTSLDPDKKGTVLGWEEVQQNWPELWREEDESKR